jgi:threonine synthase
MGLPVKQFLAATNVNDAVPEFLRTGIYQPKISVQTLSNAMDVGNPSNWIRIVELFKDDPAQLQKIMMGYSFSDSKTVAAIRTIFDLYGYVTCPHSAIAWLALKSWQAENSDGMSTGVLLSTAHACKFSEVFPRDIALQIVIPQQIKDIQMKSKSVVSIKNDFDSFKEDLLKNN